MRILVCCKVTPDFEALRESEWAAGAGSESEARVETRFTPRVLNCFDEAALETALRLSDQLAARGEEAALAALSVGGQETEPFLATLRALGFERTVRVSPGADLDFRPAATAALIAAAARYLGGGELILLGDRAGPGDGGTVPFRVAEELGRPCLSRVTDVEAPADGRLRVGWTADDGLRRATISRPCILAVGNAVVAHLRVPTLGDRLVVRHHVTEVLSPADLGVDLETAAAAGTCSLMGLDPVDRSRQAELIVGDTSRDRARAVYDAYVRKALEET